MKYLLILFLALIVLLAVCKCPQPVAATLTVVDNIDTDAMQAPIYLGVDGTGRYPFVPRYYYSRPEFV